LPCLAFANVQLRQSLTLSRNTRGLRYLLLFFFLMHRPPPSSTLFPYTTLFRSLLTAAPAAAQAGNPSNPADFTRNPHPAMPWARSEEHTSELQSLRHLVCRLLLEKKKKKHTYEQIRSTTTPTQFTNPRRPSGQR